MIFTDFEKYKIINKAYTGLLDHLEKNDTNFVPAVAFLPEHTHLYFKFEQVDEPDCAAKLISLHNVIYFISFYFTEEPTLEKKLDIIRNNFDILYHELTHYFDFKRGAGCNIRYNLDDKSGNFLDRYFNDPLECNAYTPYIVNPLYNILQRIEENPENKEKYKSEISSNFSEFYINHCKSFDNKLVEKTFMDYLNKHNKRRLIKRLYKLHYQIKNMV